MNKSDPKTRLQETLIPFSGFYESTHSAALEEAYKQLIMDSNGDVYEDLEDELYDCMGCAAEPSYAKAYAEAFAEWFEAEFELGVTLVYVDMTSPNEYNFVTDRIFCSLSSEAAGILYKACHTPALQQLIQERFTSCGGFMSYYENSLAEWGSLDTWDHNQIGILIECIMSQTDSGDLDGTRSTLDFEYYMLDDEAAARAVADSMPPALIKLVAKVDARLEKENLRRAHEANQLPMFPEV